MPCPTPSKRTFRSKAEAKRYNRQFSSHQKARLWPYPCEDHWHLTNQNYDEQKRVARAIARRLGRDKNIPSSY